MTVPPPGLRPLRASDLPEVMRLEPVLFGAGQWSRAVYQDEVALPDRSYVAAVEGARLVGYAGLAHGIDASVMTIGVDPAFRRRGHAARMLAELVARARAAGSESVFLEVRAADGGAQALYVSFGFEALGIRRGYYQPEGADALVMRLRLRPDPSPGPVGAEAVEEAETMGSADTMRRSVLVTAEELAEQLSESDPAQRPVLLDVRWSLAEPDGRRFYLAGHVPGAQYADLDHDLAGPASREEGRHPLPDLETLQAAARRWGIDDGDPVVVYDDTGGTSAARAWWLLRWAGIADVRILDGGLRAWSESGGILEDGDVQVAPGAITLSSGHMPVADAEETAAVPSHGVLLDARATERYTGEVEPVDPRAGHIPGAVSAPTAENLDSEQRFRPSEDLRRRFTAVGAGDAEDVVVYCGSGVTAAHEVAALAAVGVAARLYPGSWSQWSADEARPVATSEGTGSRG